jgi:hypothetical protein
MKISFKQRTIDNKIKVYDSIITSWVKMRNEIFSQNNIQDKQFRINKIYGESQAFIGEIFLVTENNDLAALIDQFNERFYRQPWFNSDLSTINQIIEALKIEAISLITLMRDDIYESTILKRDDIFHIWSSLIKSKKLV